MKYLIMAFATVFSITASAMVCIPLGGSDDFQRVSTGELIVTDMYGQKYKVTVESCPELMMDEPIVVAPLDDQLCSSDTISVGGDICPITSILTF